MSRGMMMVTCLFPTAGTDPKEDNVFGGLQIFPLFLDVFFF